MDLDATMMDPAELEPPVEETHLPEELSFSGETLAAYKARKLASQKKDSPKTSRRPSVIIKGENDPVLDLDQKVAVMVARKQAEDEMKMANLLRDPHAEFIRKFNKRPDDRFNDVREKVRVGFILSVTFQEDNTLSYRLSARRSKKTAWSSSACPMTPTSFGRRPGCT